MFRSFNESFLLFPLRSLGPLSVSDGLGQFCTAMDVDEILKELVERKTRMQSYAPFNLDATIQVPAMLDVSHSQTLNLV